MYISWALLYNGGEVVINDVGVFPPPCRVNVVREDLFLMHCASLRYTFIYHLKKS